MPVYWGVRWDLNPCHKEPQSSALPDWATNTVLMERLELSTTALWEQPSTIEVHQHIFLKDKELEWASKDLNLHYYLIRVASWPIRRHAHYSWEGRSWTHNCWFWRPVFYQLNYFPIMLLLLDLNQWPLGCKPSILTTELRSIDRAVSLTSNCPKEGSSKSSTLWKHENIVWRMRDLNPELLLAREVC